MGGVRKVPQNLGYEADGEPERGGGEEQVCPGGYDPVGELPRQEVQSGSLGG